MTTSRSTHLRLPVVTNSELRTYRRCATEHYYAYQLGFRPLGGEAEPLRFGSLFHTGLEAWWRAYREPDTQLAAALEAIRPLALDDFDLVRAGVLLQAYDARWHGALDVEILGVELEFRAPLLNPNTTGESRTFQLGGKLDALVLNRNDGRVYMVEHKTTSENIEPGSTYWQRLELDAQVSTYWAGARALGVELSGCLYDVIGKPRHAPLKATPEDQRKYTKQGHLYANQRGADETPDEYRMRLTAAIMAEPERFFARGFVVRLPTEEKAAAHDTWQAARQLRDDMTTGMHSRNTASCERYGRMCSFFDVCTRKAAIDDWTRFERVANVHPELNPEFVMPVINPGQAA